MNVLEELRSWGINVKVNYEVESLVRRVARITGYLPHTVRNMAILYGLERILNDGLRLRNDSDFFSVVLEVKGYVEEKEREKESKLRSKTFQEEEF